MYVAIFTIILAFLAAAIFIFKNLGNWLVKSDETQKADLIFILLGPVPDRALQAYDLYKAGFAGKIVFANEFQYGSEQLKPFGITLENTSSVFKRTLIQLGVKPEDVEILPQVTSSTQEEAKALREFLKNNPEKKKVLLVTSSYHSRRTTMIFKKALKKPNPGVEIISIPSSYTIFDAKQWWKQRDSAKMVVLEYVKLLNFMLIERFRL